MNKEESLNFNLCSPNGDVSCFRCCPPIRPCNYDHVSYVSTLKRLLRENTEVFNKYGPVSKPIVGFFCWALGYIDREYKRVGCMLHPLVNNGLDLRYMINYGNKCARESCTEATIFDRLSEKCKIFWLEVTNGLNAFYYSSDKANPIFHLLRWGTFILQYFYQHAVSRRYNCTELLWRFPFLIDRKIDPKKWRLPVRLLCENINGTSLENFNWWDYFTYFQKVFAEDRKAYMMTPSDGGLYVHRICLDEDLSSFIRFFMRRNKIAPECIPFIWHTAKRITLESLYKSKAVKGNVDKRSDH